MIKTCRGGQRGGGVLDRRFLAVSLVVSPPCCVTLAPFQGTIRPPRKAGGLDARMIVCCCQNGPGLFWVFLFVCFGVCFFFSFYLSFWWRGKRRALSMLHASCSLLSSSSSISPYRGEGVAMGGGGAVMDSSSNTTTTTTRPNLAQADVPLIKAQLNSLRLWSGGWRGLVVGGAAADRLSAKQSSIRLGRPDVHHEVTQIALARPPAPLKRPRKAEGGRRRRRQQRWRSAAVEPPLVNAVSLRPSTLPPPPALPKLFLSAASRVSSSPGRNPPQPHPPSLPPSVSAKHESIHRVHVVKSS